MIELGLQRISRLLAETPLPWRAIHVAGTNGKGSVCAYVADMLEVYNASSYRKALGRPPLRYGKFNSPHLVDREDCVTISGGCELDFASLETSVLERNKKYMIGATEFESLTATAFKAFTQHNVDLAIVEVGMGGRLDATNVLGQPSSDWASQFPNRGPDRVLEQLSAVRPLPLVTTITKIGMDHQGFLGNTIEEIAKQKAGIIKHGVPVVFDSSNSDNICQLLADIAAAHSCPLVDCELPNFELISGRPKQTTRHSRGSIPPHTQNNIDTAYATTVHALERFGCLFRDSNPDSPNAKHPHAYYHDLISEMYLAPFRTVIPGRLEYVDLSIPFGFNEELALLDGAHNAQSAAALADEVDKLRLATRCPPLSMEHNADDGTAFFDPQLCESQSQARPITYMIATSSTKECIEILKPLLRPGDSLFAVEFGPVAGMPWVKPTPSSTILSAAEPLLANFEGVLGRAANFGTDLEAALRQASLHARATQSALVIAGSLYLVGDVHRLLRRTLGGSHKVRSWNCVDTRPTWRAVQQP